METSGGYSPKDLHFAEDARSKLISGISKMAKAVKSTLGPMGNTVLIESNQHTHGITVTKDGVTVAKSIQLLDPVENLAVQMMREAASRTAANAGDGTTTAIVLTEALVTIGVEELKKAKNKPQVLRDMVDVTNEIVDSLKKRSKTVSKQKLLDVATISANNDAGVGKIIADTYNAVGKNGIVTVEKSQGSETGFETTHGLKVDRGYSSPLFINNQKKDECILEDVYVLVSDAEINNILSIENILKPIINENKKLLIVAPCSQNVINTLAANVMKNNLKLCAIIPPSFGYKQHELMGDIALSVGATYFSEKTGDDLSLITFNDLGRAQKIIVGKDSSIILKDDTHVNKEDINDRVGQLKDAHSIATSKADKDFIMSRIASLTGGVGVIYVGGNTDLEQKELFDRVDDAVCAVRSALEEGILPGGGLALYQEGVKLLNSKNSKKIAKAILGGALKEPLLQIQYNAGIEFVKKYEKDNIGLDVKNNKEGDLIDMGIIDPMKVTKQALQNAVSVAVTILSTNAIVTMARTYETQ
ncbi:MAG: chaperonin GroEL [Proteobacteria bacterium]|nr:chaperonin GroEL [Pseudomonadota bacterium]